MARRLCRGCRKRPSKYRVKGGRVRADRHHDLCFECHRAVLNWLRSLLINFSEAFDS